MSGQGADMRGRKIKAGGANAGKWDEQAFCADSTIAIGDIVNVVGMTGNYKRVSKAQSSVTADISGPVYMAQTKGVSGQPMRISQRGVITGTTTGATVGDPVYMSATAGGFSLTANNVGRKVGSVAVVGNSTLGRIDFDGGAPGVGLKIAIAAVAGATSVTVLAATLGGTYGGRPVTATTNTGTTIYVITARWSTNDLIITFSASYTGDVTYMIGLI